MAWNNPRMESKLERELIFREILEQPDIARRRAQAPPPPWPEAGGRTLICGCGDSLCAAELCAGLFPDLGLEALPATAAGLEAEELGPDDALIAISASGRTPRVIEAAGRARGQGATAVAVTDDPESPLARSADRTWTIDASPPEALRETDYRSSEARGYVGFPHDVAQTKTFLAAVLAIARAASAAGGARGAFDAEVWSRLGGLIEDLCRPELLEPIQESSAERARAGQAFFLAGPPALPLARFGAYKMFEFNRPAHFAEVEEYCHTHYFVTRPGDAVVFLPGGAAGARRAAEIAPVLHELFEARIAFVRTADLEAPPPVPGSLDLVLPAVESELERAIAQVVAVEWLAYLWGRIGAPDVDTFHAGYDTEKLVGASMRTIRSSRVTGGD